MISRSMEKRLEVTEMWMWRRILSVSWTDKVTNGLLKRKGREQKLVSGKAG